MASAAETFDVEKVRNEVFQPSNRNIGMIIKFVAETASTLRKNGRLQQFVFLADKFIELLQGNVELKKYILLEITIGYGLAIERHECTNVLKYYLEVEKMLDDSMHEQKLSINILVQIGKAYLFTAHYRKTLEYTLKAEKIAIEIKEKPGEASCCTTLGVVYCNLGEFENSIMYCQKGLEISSALGDRLGIANNNGNLGNAYRNLGEYEEAFMYYEKGLEISREIGDRLGIASSNGNLGSVYCNLGEYEKAIMYYEKSYQISSEIGDRSGIARNTGNLGNAYCNLGEYEKAITYYQKGLEISSAIGDRSGIARNTGNLGNANCNLGEYEKAITYYEKSYQISSEIGDRLGIASCNGNLGDAYRNLGKYEQAIMYYQKGLEISSEIGDRLGIASCNGNLGNAYRNLGEYEKAIMYYEKGLEISSAIGDRSGIASCNGNLGNAYRNLGEYEKAIMYYQKGLEISSEIADRSGIAIKYENLGNAYRDLGEYEKAITYYQKGLEISRAIGVRSGIASNIGNMGNAYCSLGEYEKALEFLMIGLKISIEICEPNLESWCLGSIGFTYFMEAQSKCDKPEAFNIFQQAASYLVKSIHCSDQIFSNLVVDQNRISFAKQYFQMYVILMRCFIFLKRIEAALLVIDLGKAKALLAFMEKVKKSKTDASMDLTWKRIDKNEEKMRTEEIQEALELKSNSSLLLYTFDEDKFLNIWVTNSEVDVKTFKHNAFLEAFDIFFNVLRSSENVPSEYSIANFQLLYQILIHPVKEFIRGTKIIIVPDKFLFFVPFCSLVDENGWRLTENYSIQIAPSLHTLMSSVTRSRDSGLGFALFVGNPTVGKVSFRGQQIEPCLLPIAGEEVKYLAPLFEAQPLVEGEATKEKVLKFLHGAAIIHIAAHGEPDGGEIFLAPSPNMTEQSSSLPKENSYILKQRDIMKIDINARLVVLCCSCTGQGEISSEGVVGLARAFLCAGARSVLATLWRVHDEGTKEFMKIFYDNICNETSVCEALRRTMNMFQTHENEEFRSFKVWAPFTIHGEDVSFTRDDIEEIKRKSREMNL